MLVSHCGGVLSLGQTIPENEDALGVGLVVTCKDLEVVLDHGRKVHDDLVSTGLQSDLGGVESAVGIKGGDGAGDRRSIVVSGFDRGLTNISFVLPVTSPGWHRPTCPRSAPSSMVLPLIIPGKSVSGT